MLTDGKIKAASRRCQSSATREEIRDERQPGLHVCITVLGTVSWSVRYRVDGVQRRATLGKWPAISVAKARMLARDVLARVATGHDPAAAKRAKREAMSVAEAFERMMGEPGKRGLRKPRTEVLYRQLWRDYLDKPIGARKLADVARSDVESIKAHVQRRQHASVANRVLQLLSAVYGAAERWGEVQGHNPCRGVSRYREQGRERYLQPDELARLWAALDASDQPPGVVTLFRLLIRTGARLSEILNLEWSMVDWQSCALRLPDSKTGRKSIQCDETAMEILRAARRDAPTSKLVCESSAGTRLRNPQRSWYVIRGAAGLDDVRIHDLRHSFASAALNSGTPLAIVGALLGHSDTRTTQRYAHVSDAALRRAVESTGRAQDAAIERKHR